MSERERERFNGGLDGREWEIGYFAAGGREVEFGKSSGFSGGGGGGGGGFEGFESLEDGGVGFELGFELKRVRLGIGVGGSSATLFLIRHFGRVVTGEAGS